MLSSPKTARILLQIGLAFVFAYASVEIYIHPENFTKYIPPYMNGLMGHALFLDLFGVAEVALVLWLLSGRALKVAGLISCVLLLGITLSNLEFFPVLFRNVAIAFAALALVVLGNKS